MLMRGDLNKIITEVNTIIEKLANRVDELEDKVKILEAEPAPKAAPSKGGRPKKEVEGF